MAHAKFRLASAGMGLEGIVTGSGSLAALERSPQPQVIDERHLAGMTLGDTRLEREVLELFLSQAAAMLERAGTAPRTSAAAAAHRGLLARGGWREPLNRSKRPWRMPRRCK